MMETFPQSQVQSDVDRKNLQNRCSDPKFRDFFQEMHIVFIKVSCGGCLPLRDCVQEGVLLVPTDLSSLDNVDKQNFSEKRRVNLKAWLTFALILYVDVIL